MDLVKPWLVSHAVKELGQVLEWRDQGENLSLPGGEAGGSVFEDDGKTIKIKPTKLGQTAQLIKFGKSIPLIEATLSDSKTRIPITFDSASIQEYEAKSRQPLTHRTLGAVIQIQEYEIRATAVGPRSDRLSLYVTKFGILGANGSGIFGEVPRGIESEEVVRGLLRKLESQRQKREQLGSAESSTRRSSLNSNNISSPVKDGKSLDEAHPLADSSVFATQMARIPSGLSTELLPSGKDLARYFDNATEELNPPNNADLIRDFQRRKPKQPSPAASFPTSDEPDRTSNIEITSTDDRPGQIVKESGHAVLPIPENHTQTNGERGQDAHPSISLGYARRSHSTPQDNRAANSASVNEQTVPAIVPAKRKRRERVSARDVKIHKDQENLLARPDSWLPAEPGQREPMANIPIQILNELNYVADSSSEVAKRSPSPRGFEHEQRAVSHIRDVSSPASLFEDDQDLDWGSSPIREAAETLPADSSRSGSSQSNKFSNKQISGLSNLEATSLGYVASSFQGHTKNGSASVASSPRPARSLNLSLNGGSSEIMLATDKAHDATHQHDAQGSMSGDERFPSPCTSTRGKTCGPSDPLQSLDGYHSSNDNRIRTDQHTPSSIRSAVSPSQTNGGESKGHNHASASASPPLSLRTHSHSHTNLAESQSLASPTFSDSDLEISIPHTMEESESHSEQASSPAELPSTAIQAQVPFTQVKRTPYVNGFISRTESTSVEHPTSSETQDVSRISGTSLGDSNILSSARSNDAAAAVIERDAELELPPEQGEQPLGRTLSEGRVKDPGATSVRDPQTNFRASAAEEHEMVEELHSDMDAPNILDHHPLKMQDEELSFKHEVMPCSTKRKDDFANAYPSRTSKRAKLSDFLPEHLSQEEEGSTNLRNLVDRHRKDFFTSRRSSASSAQVSNPASPAKLAGGTLPSLLSNAERHRPTQKPDDDNTQPALNTRASSNAAPEKVNATPLMDPEAVNTPDQEDGPPNKSPNLAPEELGKQHPNRPDQEEGLPNKPPNLAPEELGKEHPNRPDQEDGLPNKSPNLAPEELGKQHPNVAEARGSPDDSGKTPATYDSSDQASREEQNPTQVSPLPAPTSVVGQESVPIAPVVLNAKAEEPEGSGSTSRVGPSTEDEGRKVASPAPPSLEDEERKVASPAPPSLEDGERKVASPAPPSLDGDTEGPPDKAGERPESIKPPADLQIQEPRNTSPSNAEKGSGNQESINQPKVQGHQSIHELFKASYPSYTGNQKHFGSMCTRIKKLMVDGGCPHQFLWDDFIIRQKTDYSVYVQKCTEDAEDPVSYEQYYSNAIEEPLHTKKVVTARNLHDALPEQSEKSFGDRHGYESAVLPRIGAYSTRSDTSSLDSREPLSLTKIVRSATRQGRVASPLANESTTFGIPQSPQQPVQSVTGPLTATFTSPPSRFISPPRTTRIPTGRQEPVNVTIDLTLDDEEPSPIIASSRSETVKRRGQSAKIRRSLPWSNTETPSRTQAALHDLGQSLGKRSRPQSPHQALSSSRFGKDRQHEVIDVESTRAPLVDKGKQPGTQRSTLDTPCDRGGSRSLVPNSRGLLAGANNYPGHEPSQEQQQGWWRDPDTPYNKFVRDMAAIQPGRGNSYASPDNVRRGKAIQKQRQSKLKHVHMAELGL